MPNRYTSGPIFMPDADFNLPAKIIFGVGLYVSVCLIARMWLKYRNDSLTKKLFWSVILLMPLAGWVFYAAFYNPYPYPGGKNPPE